MQIGTENCSGGFHLRVSKEKEVTIQMLQVEHLSYDVLEEGKQSEILSDVSFTVNDGEMLVKSEAKRS